MKILRAAFALWLAAFPALAQTRQEHSHRFRTGGELCSTNRANDFRGLDRRPASPLRWTRGHRDWWQRSAASQHSLVLLSHITATTSATSS